MEIFNIISFIFSIVALVVSLITFSMLVGWKNSTHRVYTKYVKQDPKDDISNQMNAFLNDIESDEI